MISADEIYSTHIAPIEKSMMRTVYRIVRDPDDAADAFQDALVKVWRYLERIIHHPNPQAYILSICITSAYDTLRKRARQTAQEVPMVPELSIPLPQDTHTKYAHYMTRLIQQCIASMPLKQAQAVLLRLFEDESFQTIGAVLGCTEATARSHVSKGLARLRALMSDVDNSVAEETV